MINEFENLCKELKACKDNESNEIILVRKIINKHGYDDMFKKIKSEALESNFYEKNGMPLKNLSSLL